MKGDKWISGRLEIKEDSLVFIKGEWPFTKTAWEKSYDFIQRIGSADEILHYVPFGGADYEFKVHLLDGSFEIFRLLGPGYAAAWDLIHALRAKVRAAHHAHLYMGGE